MADSFTVEDAGRWRSENSSSIGRMNDEVVVLKICVGSVSLL